MNKWGITARLLLVPVVSVLVVVLAVAFAVSSQQRSEAVLRRGLESETRNARLYADVLARVEADHGAYLELATGRLAGTARPTERRGLNALIARALDLNAAIDTALGEVAADGHDAAVLSQASKDLADYQDVLARLSLKRNPQQVRGDVVESNELVTRVTKSLTALLASARSAGAYRGFVLEARGRLTVLAIVMALLAMLAFTLAVRARRAIRQPLGATAAAMRDFRERPDARHGAKADAPDDGGDIAAGFNAPAATVQRREPALQAQAGQLRDGDEAMHGEAGKRRNAEAQLIRSLEQLEAAQAAGGIGVYDLDLDAQELRGSAQFFTLLGLPAGIQVIRQDQWLGLVHPDDLDSLVAAFTAAVEKGGSYRVEYRIGCTARALRWVTSAGRVILGDGPGGRRIVGSLMDISERKQSELALREAEGRLARAVRGTSDGLFERNLTTGQVWFAPRVAELLGYRPEEFPATAAGFNDLVHADDRPLRDSAISAHLDRGVPFDVEFRIRDAAGCWQWMRARARTNRDAASDSIILSGSMQLVTDRRLQAEELERARAAAERASRAKSEFLANVSHEIRTPINGVIGMTHVLLDSPLTGAQRECVEILRSSGESLLTLINDILDMSKIEAGKLELERIEFDVRAVVDDAIGVVAMAALAKHLELAAHIAADVPPSFRGDPGRLRQCLVNLLGNAVKFTTRGSVTVEVELLPSQPPGSIVKITVADTGIGIAADRLDRLFREFSQVDSSTTRHFGGTGLGLSIVRHLATLMGGDAGVSSAAGEGSRFWFTARLEAGAAGSAPGTGARILVLDNEPVSGGMLARQLRSLGHAASWFPDPAGFAATLAGLAPGGPVIAMIAAAPAEGDALALATGARNAKCAPSIVLLSRLANAPLRPPAGVDAVLTKPIRHLQLASRLAELSAPGRPAASIAQALPSRARPPRVLLVEDNAVNQRVAQYQLTRLGCHVEIAGNGSEAVAAVAAARWDIVLMDCQMPVLDGFDATRAIRHQEAGLRHVPIIALTANALHGDRDTCLAAGMDDFLAKPLDPAALAACIDRWAATDSADGDGQSPREPRPAATATPGAAAPDGTEPLVDLRALREITDGDLEFERELLEVFISSGDATLAALSQALDREDLAAVRRHAHTLKGASANLRARPLAARALAIEQAAAAGNLVACRNIRRGLEDEYRATAAYIGARRA